MSEYFEHNPGDHEDPVAGPTWLIAFISVVLLVVTLLGLTALFYVAEEEERVEKVVQSEVVSLDALHDAQLARISADPHFEQRDNGGQVETSLVIPIDRAMDLTVREYTSE